MRHLTEGEALIACVQEDFMTSEQPTLTIFNESLTSHFLPPPVWSSTAPTSANRALVSPSLSRLQKAGCSNAAKLIHACLSSNLSACF